MNRYSNLSPAAARLMDQAWSALAIPTDENVAKWCEHYLESALKPETEAALRELLAAAKGSHE